MKTYQRYCICDHGTAKIDHHCADLVKTNCVWTHRRATDKGGRTLARFGQWLIVLNLAQR